MKSIDLVGKIYFYTRSFTKDIDVWGYLADQEGWHFHTGQYRRGTGQKFKGGVPPVSWNRPRLIGGIGDLAGDLAEFGVSDIGRSLYPRQVFFPMAGAKEGRVRLATNLKAEIDEELIEAYRGTVSLPFEPGEHRRIAVKIVDDRGIESLKLMEIER
jgi:hypothetical protein